jgi:hypothetical protein
MNELYPLLKHTVVLSGTLYVNECIIELLKHTVVLSGTLYVNE